jgi:hypothetical protein
LKKFIYGLLFGLLCIPILETLLELIVTYLELPKAYITKKILKENKIIADLQLEQEHIETVAMGFQIPSEDEYEEDDDFDDKKNEKKSKK